MSVSGIHGRLLEVTVVGCNRLKDTEWFSKQDPYVCLEYGSTKYKTTADIDGDKNPTFQEKFVFTLIEGLREINVYVWNSNTLTSDDYIGTGKIQLQKVLSQGFDDNSSTLHSKTGRYAGEVRLMMHYAKASKPVTSLAASTPPYGSLPLVLLYGAPTPATTYPPTSAYPPSAYPPPSGYPPTPAYPSWYQNPSAYPPNPSVYPPSAYLPVSQPTAYPPQPCPPPQATSNYPPPGPYYGSYPLPPY